MANDFIFKKRAFGGYDKDSVLEYVKGLVGEKTELEVKLANNKDKYAKLMSEYNQLKNDVTSTEALSDEVASLRDEVASLKKALEEKQASLDLKDELLAAKENELSAALLRGVDTAELDALKAENERLKAEGKRREELERQVGAAMLDARIRSDELVEAAKQRADTATRKVYDAIGETALKIDDLSTGIADIARSFTKSVEEVELRIKVLTGDMSKTAQTLISAGCEVPKATICETAEDIVDVSDEKVCESADTENHEAFDGGDSQSQLSYHDEPVAISFEPVSDYGDE